MRTCDAGTILRSYYAATAAFLVLDFAAGVNLRLAFLDDRPEARIAWYLFCLCCSGMMMWRPAWTELIGAFESLLTLVALIIGVGMRVLLSADAAIDSGEVLSLQQIINFLLAGGIAYVAWFRGITALFRRSFGKEQ